MATWRPPFLPFILLGKVAVEHAEDAEFIDPGPVPALFAPNELSRQTTAPPSDCGPARQVPLTPWRA